MFIEHWTKQNTGEEYIILHDEAENMTPEEIEENTVPGFEHSGSTECDLDAGVLPTGVRLEKNY